jgi:ankyrin repeat protein
MSWLMRLMVGLAIGSMAAPALAQLANDGDRFISFLRDGEKSAALALLESKPIIIDATDSRGETALLVSVKGRDAAWTAHLIKSGANPNIAARNGETPLIAAARIGFTDAVRWLIGAGAKVDATNKRGETPLIVAVQERHVSLVRLLLSAGADPDRTDSAAGFSARDYAKRETRFPDLLAAINASNVRGKPETKPASGKLDDFKLN